MARDSDQVIVDRVYEEDEDGEEIVVITKTYLRDGKVVKKVVTRKPVDEDDEDDDDRDIDEGEAGYYNGFWDHYWLSKVFGNDIF